MPFRAIAINLTSFVSSKLYSLPSLLFVDAPGCSPLGAASEICSHLTSFNAKSHDCRGIHMSRVHIVQLDCNARNTAAGVCVATKDIVPGSKSQCICLGYTDMPFPLSQIREVSVQSTLCYPIHLLSYSLTAPVHLFIQHVYLMVASGKRLSHACPA